MARKIAPRRVAKLQRKYLREQGATPAEIRRFLPYLTAQIGAESAFIEGGSHSSAGAQDIAQFMPGTARSYGVRLGDNRIKDDIRGQIRYMLPLLRKYGVEGALRGYNAGPGAIEASKSYGQTNAYVDRIQSTADQYRGLVSAGGGTPGSPAQYRTIPGEDNSALRQQALISYLAQRGQPGALANLGRELQSAQDTPSRRVQTRGSRPGSGPVQSSSLPQGTAHFEGRTVAAWIKPALVYARKHGWEGQVNSGFRSFEEQQRIYNSGVRPAAKPGTSNHEGTEFPRGAVDVSNAEQLAQILRGTRWGRLLKWAGSKDPVHFSHPHGGSY